jgi:NYN domain
MSRVAVLVDAGYLFKAGGQLLAARDVRREELLLTPSAATKVLAETGCALASRELLRIYWYDAALKNRFDHREIAQEHHVKLRLGHLNSAGEQKGVDPLIIMDMITLSQNRACDEMVLLTGDADLIVGVLQAQERGVRVHLLGIAPSRANQSPLLREEADTCSEWGKDVVSGFLRLATADELKERQQARLVRPRQIAKEAAKAGDAPPAGQSATRTMEVISAPAQGAAVAGATDARVGPDLALLETVVEAVLPQLKATDREAIRASSRPGVVPGNVDGQLLGTAKQMLNTILPEAEKRLLRRLLYDRCQTAEPTK